MADDVDEPTEAKEPTEPWPVWLGVARDGEGGRERWRRRSAWADIPRAMGLMTAAFVLALVAVGSGYTQIPFWLLLGHLPFFLKPYYAFLFADAFSWPGMGRGGDPSDFAARGRLMAETSRARPEIPDDKFTTLVPILLTEAGFESLLGWGPRSWKRFGKYEYIGEEGQAYVFRLHPAEKTESETGEAAEWHPGFWRRLALAVPMIVSLYAFVVGLEQHGWRVDTIAAFCALLAHLILRRAVKRLRRAGFVWFFLGDAPVCLIFDKRIVTLSEAITRLNRHLPAATEIA